MKVSENSDISVMAKRSSVFSIQGNGKIGAFQKAFSGINPPILSDDGLGNNYSGMYILDQSGRDVDLHDICRKLVGSGKPEDVQILLWLLSIPWHESVPSNAHWIAVVSIITSSLEELHDETVVEPILSYLSRLLEWLDFDNWTGHTYYSALSKDIYYVSKRPNYEFEQHEGSLAGIVCPLVRILHQYRPKGFFELLVRIYSVVQTTFLEWLYHGDDHVDGILDIIYDVMLGYCSEYEVLKALHSSLKYPWSTLHFQYLEAIEHIPVNSYEHSDLVEILTASQENMNYTPWRIYKDRFLSLADLRETGLELPKGRIQAKIQGNYAIIRLWFSSRLRGHPETTRGLARELKNRILTYGYQVWWDLRNGNEWRTYAPIVDLLGKDQTWLELQHLEFEVCNEFPDH